MKRFLKKLFSKVMFVILICIIVLAGFFFWGLLEKQIMKVKGTYYIYKGDQAYAQDNMAKTLEYYRKGLELYPEHYEAWYNLGNIYAVYEDYYSAADAYEHAIEYNPKFVPARMNLGIIYSEDLGFFDQAIEQFDEISKLDFIKLWIPFIYNNISSVKGNRGLAYYNKGVAYRRKALFLPPEKQYMAYEYLGEAVKAYDKAQKILNKSYDIVYNKAIAHYLRGEYQEAGLDYCKAIKLSPMNFEAHYNLAVLLRHLNRYNESVNELEKAAQLVTENPASSSSLQSAYIFNLLNEVSRKFITSDNYNTEKLTQEPSGNIGYTFVGGKLVPDEELDKAVLKNFALCSGFDYFNMEEE